MIEEFEQPLREAGFYKLDDGVLLYAPNFVTSMYYDLNILEKDNYEYPVDGWYYFENEQDAISYNNLSN
jgi:hypothetical protein